MIPLLEILKACGNKDDFFHLKRFLKRLLGINQKDF